MFNIKKKDISLYICGPTVYDHSHLGHARVYITFDILCRILKYFNYKLNTVMNITDIDDKIIKKFNSIYPNGTLKEYKEFITYYEQLFYKDMADLDIDLPNIIKVSDHIPQIIKFIEKMVSNNSAYKFNNSIWYNSTKALISQKNNTWDKCEQDFVIWKNKKNEDGNIYFESPFGQGRPGWHVECSTIATSTLGDHIDIHMGGIDLKFPHHHNENLQTEAFYDYKENWNWVDNWIHVGHLEIVDKNGIPKKMSKSLKNFITIREYLQKYSARSLRLLFISNDYSKSLTYNELSSPKEAQVNERKLIEFFKQMNHITHMNNIKLEENKIINFIELDNIKENILTSLHNFKIHKTLKYIYQLKSYLQSISKLSKIFIIDETCKFMLQILQILGLDFWEYYIMYNDQDKFDIIQFHQTIKKIIKIYRRDLNKFVIEANTIFQQYKKTPAKQFAEEINEIIKVSDKTILLPRIYEILDKYRAKYNIPDFL